MIPLRDVANLAVRNLWRNGRRSLLSACMLGVCLASILMQQAYGYRYERHLIANAAYVNYAGHVSVYRRGALDRLAPSREDIISPGDIAALTASLMSRREVAFVARYLIGSGVISNGCMQIPFIGLGLDPDAESRIREHAEPRRWLSSETVEPMRLFEFVPSVADALTITSSMAAKLGKPRIFSDLALGTETTYVIDCEGADVAKVISEDATVQMRARGPGGELSTLDATIVQHRSTGRLFLEDVATRMSLPFMQQLLQTDGVTYVAVFLNEGIDAARFAEEWSAAAPEALRNGFDAFAALSDELNAMDRGTILWQTTMDIFLLTLLGMIVVILVMNFLSMAIMERRSEIGIMRAIGFLPRAVMASFFAEFALVTVGGLAIGIAMTLVGVQIVNALGITYSPPGAVGLMRLVVDPSLQHVLAGSAIVGAIALISTWIVTGWYAQRDSIVELFGLGG